MSSNASLDKSIDDINQNSPYFTRVKVLSDDVSIYEDQDGYYNYFIFLENKCVGVVIGGCNELHWYLKEKNRGSGIMTRALQRDIVPYLFNKCKCEKIKITIDKSEKQCSFDASLKIARSIGFEVVKSYEFGLLELEIRKGHLKISTE